MKNTATLAAHKLLNLLKLLGSRLESYDSSGKNKSKFVDLAPTDAAAKSGIYSEALFFAINNDKISNIALTGPYGSGKSSIIRSFLKKYRRPALQISLAAFVAETDTKGEEVLRMPSIAI